MTQIVFSGGIVQGRAGLGPRKTEESLPAEVVARWGFATFVNSACRAVVVVYRIKCPLVRQCG
jgi:hypothetical protein